MIWPTWPGSASASSSSTMANSCTMAAWPSCRPASAASVSSSLTSPKPYAEISVPGAKLQSQQGRQAVLSFKRGEISASDLIGRVSARYNIQDLAVREPDIEATIRRIYEEQLLHNRSPI